MYTKSIGLFDLNLNEDGRIFIEGRKDEDKLIVKKISAATSEKDGSRENLIGII